MTPEEARRATDQLRAELNTAPVDVRAEVAATAPSLDTLLAPPERADLASLEAIVERGVTTFREVGEALIAIRDRRLYRESHRTFEDYCRDRWGMTRRHANRLVQASEVAVLVGPTGPTVERQARELAPLLDQPEQLREAWSEASANGEPTARQVREVVERRLPPKPPTLATERDQHETMVRVWDGACRVLDDSPANAPAKVAHLIEFDGPGPVTSERLEVVAAFCRAAAKELKKKGPR